MNKDWDGIWQGRSKIHVTGWDTEVAIPFKSLNFHPNLNIPRILTIGFSPWR